jgi:hypothetical protein
LAEQILRSVQAAKALTRKTRNPREANLLRTGFVDFAGFEWFALSCFSPVTDALLENSPEKKTCKATPDLLSLASQAYEKPMWNQSA